MTLSRVVLGGRKVTLDDRDLVGEGGEGRVYRLGAVAVKVFTQPNAERAAKLRAFPRTLPAEVIGPLDLCTDDRGAVVGYLMKLLDGGVDLARFGQRKWRAGRATNADVLALLRALAAAVDRVHAAGIVVGDLNDGNVAITRGGSAPTGSSGPLLPRLIDATGAGTPVATRDGAPPFVPWLIDADSMQLPAHPCVVGHERFLDPRFYGRDLASGGIFSRETDWYALAVMAFSMLLFVHPFGGAHPAEPTLLRRAEARRSALRPDVKLPASATRPDVLPEDALGWFERVFEKDLRAPLPAAVLDARFTSCACGTDHARARCPACAVRAGVSPVVRSCGKLRAARVFYKAGARVLASTFDSSLRWIYDDGAALRREDESVVAASAPYDLARIAGNATWLGSGRVLTKYVAGRAVAEHPVTQVHGEVAADASLEGAILVLGDTLVRAEQATRVGQVLERHTHVRTGATLGFAFYRAGGVTVASVFDPRRGPLRQIESFPAVAGRLQGWSAFFGAEHVLVTFATETNGAVHHRTHLVDAMGRVLATDDGAVFPPSLGGRAVGPGGTVLVATGAGLLLTKVDGGAFAAGRLFPEAKDFVHPDDDLHVGPGGTLYVATDHEITHLSFTS